MGRHYKLKVLFLITMKSILLVEDNDEVQILIKRVLSSYNIKVATTIEVARSLLDSIDFDLIILDIHLPDGDGLRFCSEIKSIPIASEIPIFVLTSKSTIVEKTLGFQLGIDDFIAKPFDPFELKLRVDSKIKKAEDYKKNTAMVKVGNLTLNCTTQQTSIAGVDTIEDVTLSSKEFHLLVFLAKQVDQVKSREQIIATVWGPSINLTDRTIDSHLSRIRKKIINSNVEIVAIPGSGYRLSVKEEKR